MSLTRLDKILSDSGTASRSEARKIISSGRVWVDGKPVTVADQKFDLQNTEVKVDGKVINKEKYRYFMLYKPEGVLSATEDREQKTVIDILPTELQRLKLFPVGRLDKDTIGLLILTNDGELSHSVTSPKKHVQKRYEFTADGKLDEYDVDAFKQGIVLGDGTKCLSATLEIDINNASHGYLSIFEGKYHQVKRMLAARAKPVTKLKRLSVGDLILDPNLKPGEYKELTSDDINMIVNKNVTN